jgi:hypothetical protein
MVLPCGIAASNIAPICLSDLGLKRSYLFSNLLFAQDFVIGKMVRSRNFSASFPGRINPVFDRKLYLLDRLLATRTVSLQPGSSDTSATKD